MENGGFDFVTDDCGIFYEIGFNDTKNWYEVGEATIRVSADFKGIDSADMELGEVIIYPGDFLIGAVTNYNFNQTNNSPKALSRYDIYRQTRNLINAAKGV